MAGVGGVALVHSAVDVKALSNGRRPWSRSGGPSDDRVPPNRRRPRVGLATLTAVLVALTTACAGWVGHGTVYRARPRGGKEPREATYRVGLPGPGWRPVSDPDLQVAWVRPDTGAAIRVFSECSGHGDPRLDQALDHLRVGWTNWRVLDTKKTRLVDREALVAHVEAELDGVTFRHEFWIVKKNGCLFDLSYSAPPATFDRHVADFHRVVEGFAFPVEGRT